MSDEFKIESDIPIPARAKRITRYPLASLEVGQSFWMPFNGMDPRRVIGRVSMAASGWGGRHNRKFTVRQVEDGVRCWRIA